MISHLQQFTAGFLAPARGVTLIMSNSRIMKYAILPFLMTVIVFITGIALGLTTVTGWVTPVSNWMIGLVGASKTGMLSWIIPILIWPVLVIGLLYALWVVTRVLASPLFSLLAEKVLIERGVIEDQPFRLGPWLKLSSRMFVVSLSRALFLGIVGAILFVLSFIPGVGILTALCFLMLVASDLIDYSLEALQMTFSQRIQFLRPRFFVLFGLGCSLGLVFLIPGLNFFLLPASVAGASDVVCRLVGPGATGAPTRRTS